MLKPHSFTLTEGVKAFGYPREEFEALLEQTKGDVRIHITDILAHTIRDNGVLLTLIHQDGKLVGGSTYRTKFVGREESTCVLYNLFSLTPGAGSVAYQSYWNYAAANARWFKFFVFKRAHNFYSKYSVKYWGASKTGDTYSTLGRIYHIDCKKSMQLWNSSYLTLSDRDMKYLEQNLKIFDEKNQTGIKKLKEPYLSELTANLLPYKITNIELEFE